MDSADAFDGIEKGALRSFLILSAAAAEDASCRTPRSGCGQPSLEGRGSPLALVHRLDVVHPVDDESLLGPCIPCSPDTRVPGGGNQRRVLTSGCGEVFTGKLGAFVDAAMLGADRGLADVLLDAFDVGLKIRVDVGVDCRAVRLRLCEQRAARRGKELPAIDSVADWLRVAGV